MQVEAQYLGTLGEVVIPGVGTVKRGEYVDVESLFLDEMMIVAPGEWRAAYSKLRMKLEDDAPLTMGADVALDLCTGNLQATVLDIPGDTTLLLSIPEAGTEAPTEVAFEINTLYESGNGVKMTWMSNAAVTSQLAVSADEGDTWEVVYTKVGYRQIHAGILGSFAEGSTWYWKMLGADMSGVTHESAVQIFTITNGEPIPVES